MHEKHYRKSRENLLVMVFFTLLSLLLLFYVIPVYIKVPAAAKKETFSPNTFPYFIASVLALCAVIGLVKEGRHFIRIRRQLKEKHDGHLPRQEKEKKTSSEWRAQLIPAVLYIMVILYALLITHIGFIWASLALIPLALLLVGSKKWHHYLIAFLFTGAMYTLFKLVLHIQLP